MIKVPGRKLLMLNAKTHPVVLRLLRFAVLSGPHRGPRMLRDVRARILERYYHLDPAMTPAAYHHLNAGRADRTRNDAPALFKRAAELGYMSWPQRLRPWIAGRDVLDVGGGTGVHGIGFVVAGVASYTGLDPRIDPTRDRARDLRRRAWVDFGWSGAEITDHIPRIRLFSGGIEDLAPRERFDVAVLHNVTEHLLDLESVLAATAAHLREDGQLIFNHHNFYCWNGHHKAPKRVVDIDPSDARQRQYMDWAHVRFEPPENHYFRRGLNRLRIEEVHGITARHFDIIEWTLVLSSAQEGAGRLTAEIRARHPDLRDEDFLTQHVFCRARPSRRGTLAAGPTLTAAATTGGRDVRWS